MDWIPIYFRKMFVIYEYKSNNLAVTYSNQRNLLHKQMVHYKYYSRLYLFIWLFR